jgi:Arc/MetJ-type ribon-helix-helix transcriptional regulator
MSLENESFVDGLVAAGQFASREAVLDLAVQLLRGELQKNGDDLSGGLTAREWCDRFDQWADSHKALPCEADDSRESIYAGRGE